LNISWPYFITSLVTLIKVDNAGFRKAVVPDFHGPTNDRQTAVVAAFQHAWSGYKKFAWGHDHLRWG
jgi:hypothetical protein